MGSRSRFEVKACLGRVNHQRTGVLSVTQTGAFESVAYHGVANDYEFGWSLYHCRFYLARPVCVPRVVAARSIAICHWFGNLPVENGSWALYATGSQALWQSATDPKASWAFLEDWDFRMAIQIHSSITHQLGLADAGCRPRVRWIRGASAIISSASRASLKTLTQNVRPLRDEYGAEAFYNIALLPSCRLTPNLQVARFRSRRGRSTTYLWPATGTIF